MAESIQQRLSRERPPRVQITYDVETGGSIVKTELAFVVGVIADLSGNNAIESYTKTLTKNGKPVTRDGKPVQPGEKPFTQECTRPEFADRDFVEISRDNFDTVLADFAPRLTLPWPQQNTAKSQSGSDSDDKTDANTKKDITLVFNCLDDFKPDQLIANNIVLQELLTKRNTIRDAYTLLDMHPKVQDAIKTIYSEAISKDKEQPAKNVWNELKECTTGLQKQISENITALESEVETEKEKAKDAVSQAYNAWNTAFTKCKEVENLNTTLEQTKDKATALNTAYGAFSESGTTTDLVNAVKEFKSTFDGITPPDAGSETEPKIDKDKITAEKLFTGTPESVQTSEAAQNVSAYLTDSKNNVVNKFKLAGERANIVKIMMADVAQMDRELGRVLDSLYHAPEFQALEASWRGLHYLVRKTSTGEFLRIRVFNATKTELIKNFQSVSDFDQSVLFKRIYEQTYGTLGGSPFSCLLLDHFADTDDVEFLRDMLKVAAAAHTPILTAPSSKLFGLADAKGNDSFEGIATPRALNDLFQGSKYIQWNSLRDSEDSRYLNMVMPRILLRAPYTQKDVESFPYNEMVCDPSAEYIPGEGEGTTPPPPPIHKNFLWGNAAYALAERITNAFSLYKWTAAIRGMEGGGLIEELPVFTFTRPSGDLINTIPTEVTISDRREKELSDLGFIALCYRLGTDKAVIFGGQSVNRPQQYMNDDATANARLSARLPYILNASRFAHYVKCIMRDKIGSFTDRDSVEKFLNMWLSNYVFLSDRGSQSLKAQYPLREGRVDVMEDPANPGGYSAIMYLRPHFQMEEINISIRLVAKLPAPAA